MKRTTVISTIIFRMLLFALMIFCFAPQVSYANAPQDVKLEYNSSTQNLAVTITHNSSSSGFHYIKYVEIKKNSVVLSTKIMIPNPRKFLLPILTKYLPRQEISWKLPLPAIFSEAKPRQLRYLRRRNKIEQHAGK